jgi:elongator complex protein 3
MAAHGQHCRCIRCREVRDTAVAAEDVRLTTDTYNTDTTTEHFVAFETTAGRLAGFLRLSLPHGDAPTAEPHAVSDIMPEIAGAAMIREVHVYGPALAIGRSSAGEAQHLGMGQKMIAEAQRLARSAGYSRLAVISAIGTRRYYERLGFRRGHLYLLADL